MTRRSIVNLLLVLIALEFVSTIVLVPFSVPCFSHPSVPSWFAASWIGL